jgi:hypothetical protein
MRLLFGFAILIGHALAQANIDARLTFYFDLSDSQVLA